MEVLRYFTPLCIESWRRDKCRFEPSNLRCCMLGYHNVRQFIGRCWPNERANVHYGYWLTPINVGSHTDSHVLWPRVSDSHLIPLSTPRPLLPCSLRLSSPHPRRRFRLFFAVTRATLLDRQRITSHGLGECRKVDERTPRQAEQFIGGRPHTVHTLLRLLTYDAIATTTGHLASKRSILRVVMTDICIEMDSSFGSVPRCCCCCCYWNFSVVEPTEPATSQTRVLSDN